MKKILLMALLTAACNRQGPVSYTKSIAQYRQQYKENFLTDDNSPLTAADTAYLRFYTPDTAYRVWATFTRTPDSKVFEMPTHSGKTKEYRQYGILQFKVHDTAQTLHVYQSITLMAKDRQYEDYLFIPFTDNTTYTETFGGGRYIDLKTDDIQNGKLLLDFNKCYNPYCAYAGGYSCPIPPKENELSVAIRAGELQFGKAPKE